jgi:hypothetical protein
VLKALQINDDPQLDHGAAVALQFASPDSSLALSGINAAQYGTFLRNDEQYFPLINFNGCIFVEEPVYFQVSERNYHTLA